MSKTMIAAVALAVGTGGGYWWAQRGGMTTVSHDAMNMAGTAAGKPLFYRNPMNPLVTSPVPAKDEMGMDYIPVYADRDGADSSPGTVRIDPVTIQDIGVRTAKAVRKSLTREIRAAGRVDFDEEHLALLHPKIEGWIENLRVDKTGERIRKNDILLGIYSPQLVSSEQEYLLALKNAAALDKSSFADIRQGARGLVLAARDRLKLLDVPEHQIRELEQTGKVHKALHIHSPFDGVVIKVGAREGQYVTPKTELFSIADLSTVWVYGDIFEQDLSWVAVGDEATIRVAAVPGCTFRGRIDYVYPYLESRTRTVKVRMVFDNADGLLKPEMFADVTVQANRQVDAVVVPSEAIVRSGSHDQIFVALDGGRFEPRDVTLGVSSEGETQVLSGVNAGERVVTSAQFLIDSESKLREATAKMMEAKQPTTAPSVSMDGMDMSDMDMGGLSMDRMESGKDEGGKP